MVTLVLETALDAVIVMRGDGTVADWNSQAEAIFGWGAGEAQGAEMASLIIPPQHREAHRQGLARYLATGEGPVLRKRIEITAMRRSGEEFPIELAIAPVVRDDETVFLGFIRDITDRKAAQQRQDLLLAELEHRSKNMLAVVMAIASQSAKSALSVDAFSRDYLARLSSLSRAYGLLTAKNWQAASLASLVAEVIGPHLSSVDDQLELEGGDILFPAKVALTIGMILHELTTNASKYGALRSGGKLHLRATAAPAPDGQTIRLDWRETGVGGVCAPARTGFGSRLIETSIRHELKGSMTVAHDPDGFRYQFEFPLQRNR